MSASRKAPASKSQSQDNQAKQGKSPQRDASGKFLPGNSGGPGNPFARKCAEFRKTLLNAITQEQFGALVQIILTRALQGDAAYCKILLQYLIGKPSPAADPDNLDNHEWQTIKQQHGSYDDMSALLRMASCQLLCHLAKSIMPIWDELALRKFGKALDTGKLEEEVDERDLEEEEPQDEIAEEEKSEPDHESPELEAQPIERNGKQARESAKEPKGKAARTGTKTKTHRQQTASNGRAAKATEGSTKAKRLPIVR